MDTLNPNRLQHLWKLRNRLAAGLAATALLAGGCSGDDLGAEQPTKPEQTTTQPSGEANEAQDTVEPGGEFEAEPSWQIDFSKEPEGRVDESIWHYELEPAVPTYNKEAQGYTDKKKNVRVEGGKLVLQAHKEQFEYPNDVIAREYEYTSGRIDTRESLTFEYGKVEIAAKMPEGEGTWPAFWMLSANQLHTGEIIEEETKGLSGSERAERIAELWDDGGIFYKHDGELDAMEFYGNRPGYIEGTVHTYAESNEGSITVEDASEVFHTYGVELRPDSIVWTVDGEEYHRFDKPSDDPEEWPFQGGNELYLILNLAMGGTGGGEIDDSQQKDWRFEVESVKFYDYTEPS